MDDYLRKLLAAAIVFTIAGELFFTLYIDVYGVSNIVGHFLKIISFYLVYLSLVRSALIRPYTTLFRELDSERKTLAESEARYRAIFETNTAVKLIIDPENGAIMEVNRAAKDYYGYTREEFRQLRITDINTLHPERVKAEMERARAEDRLFFEFRHRLKSGAIRDVHVYSGPMISGGRTLLHSIIIDVTDSHQADAELQKSEQLLRDVFEFVPVGLVLVDNEGRLKEINTTARDIWGGPPETGQTETRLFRARNLSDGKPIQPGDWALDRTLTEGVTIKNRLVEITVFDGIRKTILNSSAPVRDAAGGIQGAIVVYHDVSERKRLEAQMGQANKLEAVGTLAGGIAHDFNNVLGAIIGYAELSREDLGKNMPVAEHMDNVLKAANRARDLVQQILKFSRVDDLLLQPVRLDGIVSECVKMLRSSIPTTIDIRERLAGPAAMVRADAIQMHQVVMNLCTNAAQAMPEDGTLFIGLETTTIAPDEAGVDVDLPPGNYQKLTVGDTGEGIPSAIMPRIFDPFFTTKQPGQGTGMGLSVVHGIVQTHGGAIAVHSLPGRGTEFSVYLPVAEADSKEPTAIPYRAPRGRESILLVDDEQQLVEVGRRLLTRLGYRVSAVQASTEALELFRADPKLFDLVITDYTMPGLTGAALAE